MNAVLILTVAAIGHGGGLDANGGHYDHRTGEYHFHGGGGGAGAVAGMGFNPFIVDMPEPRVTPRISARMEARIKARVASAKPDEVYVIKGGTKYHLANCGKLLRDGIAISLSHAVQKYKPCPFCRPPTAAPRTVGTSVAVASDESPKRVVVVSDKTDEQKAAGLLAMAKALIRKDKPDSAAKWLASAAEKYPDTPSGRIAKEMLRDMP